MNDDLFTNVIQVTDKFRKYMIFVSRVIVISNFHSSQVDAQHLAWCLSQIESLKKENVELKHCNEDLRRQLTSMNRQNEGLKRSLELDHAKNSKRQKIRNFDSSNSKMTTTSSSDLSSSNHNNNVLSLPSEGNLEGDEMEVEKVKITQEKIEEWETVKTALLVHQQIYGSMKPKLVFTVPINSSDWPETTWGLKLGKIAESIRRQRSFYRSHKPELEEIGFEFEDTKEVTFAMIKLGMETYLHVHGDLLVPHRFVIPEDPQWPSELWGFNLGVKLKTIKSLNTYASHRDELIAMGFSYETRSRAIGWHRLRVALNAYKSIYGNLSVPVSFRVPLKSVEWPKTAWGIRLGCIVNGIRSHGAYIIHRPELEAMGFIYSIRSTGAEGKGKRLRKALEKLENYVVDNDYDHDTRYV